MHEGESMKFVTHLSKLSKSMNKKGFSLVELMVVVAIIGILATVAVPQVQKFIAKSRQSEARAMLGNYYTAQKTFFAEYNVYYHGFQQIGFSPEGLLRYRTGSAINNINLTNAGYPGDFTVASVSTGPYCIINIAECDETAFVGNTLTNANMTNTTFIAVSTGNIDSDADFDFWQMNQGKTLTNNDSDID